MNQLWTVQLKVTPKKLRGRSYAFCILKAVRTGRNQPGFKFTGGNLGHYFFPRVERSGKVD